ncbi:MAG: FAD:protein FMN transferase [Pseudomonadota bacterium]
MQRWWILVVLSTWLLACPRQQAAPEELHVVTRSEEHMSTYVTISVAAPRGASPDEAITAAFAEVARLSDTLSEWREHSEISTVNAQAGGAPVVVSAELYRVIQAAHAVSVDTEGAFDITFNALWGLWDFKAPNPRVPTPEEIAPRVALVDYRQVTLDDTTHSVRLGKPGMKMGLGGIAKGYIVDRASALLRARGFTNHLVNAGGDLYASGTRGDRKWRIGVRDPGTKQIYATLEVQDRGLATSGNYERFFIKDGLRYHHILDPKTGMPTRGIASSTVLAPDAMTADAYATAVFVLGVDRSLALAPRKGLELLLFDEAFHTRSTPGMPALLTLIAEDAGSPDQDENRAH